MDAPYFLKERYLRAFENISLPKGLVASLPHSFRIQLMPNRLASRAPTTEDEG